MYCTNCGAKVDEESKFCPVCGNKLKHNVNLNHNENKDEDEKLIEKSTYESITRDENLIEEQKKVEQKQVEGKDNSIKKFFKSFSKKEEQKEKVDDNQLDEGKIIQNDYKILNQDLNPHQIREDDIADSYYGYKPIEDRKSKEIRNKETFANNQNDTYPTDYVQQKVLNHKHHLDYEIDNQDIDFLGENSLSAQARIANKLKENTIGKTSKENTTEEIKTGEDANSYEDIPYENVEERIAHMLKKGEVKKSYDPSKSGNVYAMFRQNQNYESVDDTKIKENELKDQAISESKPLTKESYQSQSDNLNKAEEENKENKDKKSFNFKPIYLLPLLLIIVGVGVAYFLKNRPAKTVEIDLSQYVDVSYSGDDGLASPVASLDTSKLLADHGNEIAYVKKDRKNDQFSSPANQFVDELEKSTSFQFSKDSNLGNGEEITVVANVADSSLAEAYNVLFTNTIKSVIVDGLITQEFVDPFNYIDVEFAGESPNISLEAKFKEDAPEYLDLVEIAASKTSELASGEEINISLIYDEEELYNKYGIRLNPTDKSYNAPEGDAQEDEEENPDENQDEENAENNQSNNGYISSIDDLDEESLGGLKYNAGKLIKETFAQRSFTEISEINYLGAITGTDANSDDLKNRVMLVYEIKANEDYEGRYTNQFTYYSFVEYQNVKDQKDENGQYYTEGPITTDNEIYHKFFVEDDYTYYEIPYYGFAFIEEVITRINNALSGLTIDDSIAADVSSNFESSDGVVGEYQGNDTRLSIRSDGSLRYKTEQRIHQGKWQENGNDITLTIEGVNVDSPINAKFENNSLNVSEQGEMQGQSFNKMESF